MNMVKKEAKKKEGKGERKGDSQQGRTTTDECKMSISGSLIVSSPLVIHMPCLFLLEEFLS